MKRIGICFGGYCPMHQGHLDAIMRAKKENDETYVVVCGYDNEPRAEEINIPLNKRVQLVKEFFNKDEIIKILRINDTELGLDESMSESNWYVWLTAVFNEIARGNTSKFIDTQVTFYVAEEKYSSTINEIGERIKMGNYDGFDARTFVIGEMILSAFLLPKELKISGTLIRQNPQKYWPKIIKPFRRYLTKNILVIGTASEGKTTLVRDIAKYFDIPHIEEYGRTYMEKHNMLDPDLQYHDFLEFIIHQRDELFQTEDSESNNKGVVISDTDNLITLMYALAYGDDNGINLSKEDAENLKELVLKHLQRGVHWNKIFIIPPGNKFVNDGTRYMKQSTIDERMSNYAILVRLIKEITPYNIDKIVELKPSDYYGNFLTVKDYINSLYV